MARKERVSRTKVMREEGYLYYVGSDGYVYRVPMNRGGRKGAKRKKRRKKKTVKKKAAKKKKRRRR